MVDECDCVICAVHVRPVSGMSVVCVMCMRCVCVVCVHNVCIWYVCYV